VRRGYDPVSIDEAILKLKEERAIDDQRVAGAIAHAQATLKRRGRIRIRRQLEAAGIKSETAEAALDALFSEIDETSLLETALARRLRSGQGVTNEAHFARLYRYLTSRGFEAELVLQVLRRRRADVR
jgi:SOS response regulatory protein OraA/RecX